MGFKGDLSTINLADIFQTLSATQKQGTLNVQDGESLKAIYFSREGVRLLSSGRRRLLRLGEILVHAGRITSAQLETALSLQKETGARLGEVLVNLGLITPEEIDRFVRGQIEEEIYDLFTWKQAHFEFLEGPPNKEMTAVTSHATALSFDVQGLLLEAARRLDEWSQIEKSIPRLHALLLANGQAEGVALDDAARAILSHVDGTKSTHDLEDATLSSRFLVSKIVARLVDAGALRALSPEEAEQAMQEALEKKDFDRAARIGRNLVLGEPRSAEYQSRLAATERAAGRNAEAAEEYRRLGDILREDKDWANAAKAYGIAHECAPDDRAMAKVHVEALGRAGKAGEMIVEGRKLVEALLNDGRSPEAVEVARSVASFATREAVAQLLLADALLGARRKEEALGVLLAARAQLPVTEVDQQAVLDRRIAQLDPTRVPVAPFPRRRSQVPVGKIVVLLTVFLVIGGVLFALDWSARKDLAQAKERVAALTAEEKWDEARAACEEVRAAHRISFIGRAVRDALAEIDAKQRLADAAKTGEVVGPDSALIERKRTEALGLEDKGDYAGARRVWGEVEDLAKKAKADSVVAAARAGRDRVERLVKDSDELLNRAALAEDAKDYKSACALVARLRREYPLTPAAKKSFFAVLVRSEPAGATVQVDGKDLGRTPVVLHVVPGRDAQVRLTAPGCPAIERKVDDMLAGEFTWAFPKLARWRASTGGPIEAAPLLVGGRLYVASRSGVVVALDPGSGAEQQRVEVGDRSALSRAFQGAGGVLLVGSDDRRLYAFAPGEAKPRWVAPLGFPVRMPAAILTEAGLAVVVGNDAKAYAVSLADGSIAWSKAVGASVGASPAAWRGLALCATESGVLVAFDVAKGEIAWRIEGLPSIQGRTEVVGDRLYAASQEGKVVAIDLANRKVAWTRALESGASGGVSLAEGRVLVGLGTGKVVSINPSDGIVQWTCATGGAVSVPPVAGGMTVYAGSEDGLVYAIGAAEGEIRWKFDVGAKVRCGVLIGSGLIYFGADDGRVYALEP